MKNATMASPMELSHHIFPRVQPHIYAWSRLYGMKFLHWYGPRAELIVTKPDLIKDILNDKDGVYVKRDLQGFITKLIGDGLVASKGVKWQKLRKLANHAFHSESLKGMIPAMIASVEMMLERWRSHVGKEIEVFEEFKLLTSEVISRTAFGSSYLEGENIFNMLTKMALIVSRNLFTIRVPGLEKLIKTQDDIESDKLQQGIRDSVVKIIRKREEKAMSGEIENFGTDFIGLLLKAYHDDDEVKKISLDDLIDECKTFYIGGHETTTSMLSWTVFLLAVHTDWQDKARKEVVELFGQQKPDAYGIGRLTIMGMIVNESLRLYPPVINIARKVKREVNLGNIKVPAIMDVCIPVLALHHNPQVWGEDVHIFNPDRFAQGLAKATNNNTSAFLPFGSGPRTCVGLNFAITEAKLALSMILQCHRFVLSPNYVHSPVQHLTINPQHGVKIILQAL